MEKIKKEAELLSMALGIYGFSINHEGAFTVLKTIEGLNKKGDQFSIRDGSEIQALAEREYPKKEKEDGTKK